MDLVLIPAYEPDEALIGLTQRLRAENFAVLVVDDGSGADYAQIFDAVKEFATVLTLPKNSGKGAALKMGMKHIQVNCVDAQTLLDAQKHPENHQDLVVRICGFSARFVSLSPQWQDEFIHRVMFSA